MSDDLIRLITNSGRNKMASSSICCEDHHAVVFRIRPYKLCSLFPSILNGDATITRVHAAFMNGEFVVQRQEDHGFAGQTIEQTFNRDTKMKGGLIGCTTSASFCHRWILSQHLRAAIHVQCEAMAGKGGHTSQRNDLDHSRIQKDNNDVQAVCDSI